MTNRYDDGDDRSIRWSTHIDRRWRGTIILLVSIIRTYVRTYVRTFIVQNTTYVRTFCHQSLYQNTTPPVVSPLPLVLVRKLAFVHYYLLHEVFLFFLMMWKSNVQFATNVELAFFTGKTLMISIFPGENANSTSVGKWTFRKRSCVYTGKLYARLCFVRFVSFSFLFFFSHIFFLFSFFALFFFFPFRSFFALYFSFGEREYWHS